VLVVERRSYGSGAGREEQEVSVGEYRSHATNGWYRFVLDFRTSLVAKGVERVVRGSLQVLTPKTKDPEWVRTGRKIGLIANANDGSCMPGYVCWVLMVHDGSGR